MTERLFVEGPGLFDKVTGKLCSLKKIDHSIFIEDEVANFHIEQHFVNSSEKAVEMLYRFPLLSGTSPHNLRVEITDPKTKEKSVIFAKAEEKVKAQEKYDDAISEGNTAVLMEKSKDKHVSLNLGNIGSLSEVCVMTDIVQEMAVEVDKSKAVPSIKMTAVIPAIHNSKDDGATQREMGKEAVKLMNVVASIRVHSGEIESVYSPSHEKETAFDRFNEKEFVLRTKGPISLEKEMSIVVDMKSKQLANGFVEKIDEKTYAAMMSFLPNFKEEEFKEDEKPIPIEHILLVDRSGSMGGNRIRYAQQAVKLFVKSLDMDDEPLLNIIGFGSSHRNLFPSSVKFDERSFKTIMDHVDNKLKSDLGGTNMMNPLQSVLDMKPRVGYTRIVYLLTDGEADNPSRCKKLVNENAKKFRIFSFGIGRGINPSFLTNLSRLTKGRSVFIDNDDGIRKAVVEQLSHSIGGCLIRNLKVNFNLKDENVECVSDFPNSMFNLQRSAQYFFLKNVDLKKGIDIEVKFKVGKNERVMMLNMPVLDGENKFVGVFTALKKIKKLESDKRMDPKLVIDDDILRLGLKFNLLTKMTSFIGVKENLNKIEDELVAVEVKTIPYQEVRREYEEEDDEDDEFDCSVLSFAPPPKIKRSVYYVGGKATGVDWGTKGMLNDSPFRGGEMGMGKKDDKSGVKNKLYEQIKKRKSEKEEKKKKVKKSTEKIKTIEVKDPKKTVFSDKVFYEIVDHQGVKGDWNEEIAVALGLQEALKKEKKGNVSENEWITAVMVVILRMKFKNKEGEWKLMQFPTSF